MDSNTRMQTPSLYLHDHLISWEEGKKIAEIEVDTILENKPANVFLVATVTAATHAVVHYRPGKLDELASGKVPAAEVSTQFILLLTTEDGLLAQQRPHRRILRPKGETYLLYARRCSEFEKAATIERFFLMTAEEAQSVVEDKPSAVPEELQRLFFEPLSIDVLTVLYILCQGYLVVHAKARTVSGKSLAPAKKTKSIVQEALTLMGWSEVNVDVLDEQLRSTKERRALEAEVKRPSWWLDVFEGGGDLLKSFFREWGSELQQDRREQTEALISAIQRENCEEIPPELVAGAYLALHARLSEDG